MPPVNRPLNEGTAIHRTVRRVENKERATTKPGRSKVEEVVPFSAAGAVALTASGDEPQWRVRTGGQIVSASLHLKTAGSSSTVMTFYLNGAAIGGTGTVTLASSATDQQAYLGNVRAKPGDLISARVTTAGTGAKGLSAFVVMKG